MCIRDSIPPLEPVPKDHVLTRTFYLLQDFPGRFNTPDLWVEAAPPDAEQAEGMPFRNLNDGVTPVIIGGNDWAAAWATDDQGSYMFPIGRGYGGEEPVSYTHLDVYKRQRARRWVPGKWCWSMSPPSPNGPLYRCRVCSCRCWSGWRCRPARHSPRPRI